MKKTIIKLSKKLAIRRETIRALTNIELEHVAAGVLADSAEQCAAVAVNKLAVAAVTVL